MKDKLKKGVKLLAAKVQGVPDYSESPFDEAWTKARSLGLKQFVWDGEIKSTKSDMSEADQLAIYGARDKDMKFDSEFKAKIAKNLSWMDTAGGYDTDKIHMVHRALDIDYDKHLKFDRREDDARLDNELNSDLIIGSSSGDNLEDIMKEHQMKKAMNKAKGIEQDGFSMYLGSPQKYNSFQESPYKKGAYEIVGYNELLPDEMPTDDILANYGRPKYLDEFIEEYHTKNKGQTEEQLRAGEKRVAKEYKSLKPMDDIALGRFVPKKGKDGHGEYIYFDDTYNFDTYRTNHLKLPIGEYVDKVVGEPFEIHGRQYYNDYGDGKGKRKQHYSQAQLMSLDLDSKGYDKVKLQKELYNRGYPLKESISKDGTFDGVIGKETRAALEDFQKGIQGKAKQSIGELFKSTRPNELLQTGMNLMP